MTDLPTFAAPRPALLHIASDDHDVGAVAALADYGCADSCAGRRAPLPAAPARP